MGFFSAGRDQGSAFYFELPLYTAAFVGFNPEQAARAMLLSQSRLTITPPTAVREPVDPIIGGGFITQDGGFITHEVDGKEDDEKAVRHAAGNVFHVEDVSPESESTFGSESPSVRIKSARKSFPIEQGAVCVV